MQVYYAPPLPHTLTHTHTHTHTPVEMVEDGDEEVLVELKCVRELDSHLPDTVHELDKDGGSLIITAVAITMTNSLHMGRVAVSLLCMYVNIVGVCTYK